MRILHRTRFRHSCFLFISILVPALFSIPVPCQWSWLNFYKINNMARGRGREEVVSSKYINLVLFKPRLPQSILPSALPSLYSTPCMPPPSPQHPNMGSLASSLPQTVLWKGVGKYCLNVMTHFMKTILGIEERGGLEL